MFNILIFSEEIHNIDRYFVGLVLCDHVHMKTFYILLWATTKPIIHVYLISLPKPPCSLQPKFQQKCERQGLQKHQVVPGNPQHVLSSHLPTLKMLTHWVLQIVLLYGQTITLNSLVMGLWCLEWRAAT